MVTKLYFEESVQAIANAIRAKDGDSALMTVAQMPSRINALLPKERKEVWLHGPTKLNNIVVDTGLPAHMDHTIEVVGYGNIYSTSTLFGSITATSQRQVLDLLTTSMRVRFAWAGSGLQTYQYEIGEFSLWQPATYRFNKTGFTITGFNSGLNPVVITGDYSAAVTGEASTSNYFIFPYTSRTSPPGNPGVFRSAKIYDATDTLIAHFVPLLYNDWTLTLLDKVSGVEQILPSGDTGLEAYWSPYTDTLVGITT